MSYAAFAKKNIPRADIPKREKPPKKAGEFRVGDLIRIVANPLNIHAVQQRLGNVFRLTDIGGTLDREVYYADGRFFFENEIEHA